MTDKITDIGVRFKKTDGNPDKQLTLVRSYEGERICVRHGHSYIIDEESDVVTCENCPKTFNPISVLVALCKKESKYMNNARQYQDEMKRLAERKRTKCKKCGEMTEISRK